jgi:hypothetical protein
MGAGHVRSISRTSTQVRRPDEIHDARSSWAVTSGSPSSLNDALRTSVVGMYRS